MGRSIEKLISLILKLLTKLRRLGVSGELFSKVLGIFTEKYLLAEIEGKSMSPTLEQGQIVLVELGKEGDIVACQHPKADYSIVKRLSFKHSINGVTYYYLTGDNPPHSVDSRQFGHVPENLLIGKVIK